MQIDGGFSIVGIESPGPAQSRKLATKKGTMFCIGREYLFDLLRWTDSKINKCKQHSVAVSTIYVIDICYTVTPCAGNLLQNVAVWPIVFASLGIVFYILVLF